MVKQHSYSIAFRTLFFLFLALNLFSCADSPQTKATKHYTEEIIQGFEKICEQQKSRDSGTHLLDSLYKTFPFISAADKYRYYDFKQRVFEMIRFGEHSYDTAISYIDSMIAVIEDNGLEKEMSREYIQSFNTRGEYYTRIERYTDAISDIARCKQLNEKAGDSCLMGENNKTLSSIAIKQSNFQLAASLMKDALLLISACKNDDQQFRRMQRYLDDLGFIYASFGKYDSALFFHLAAEKYVLENKNLMAGRDTLFPYVALENIYGNIGIEFGIQGKYTEAETYLKKAISIDRDILHDSIHLASTQYWLGSFYLADGRIDEAEEMAEQSTLQLNNFERGFKAGLFLFKAGIAREKKQYKNEAIYRELLARIVDTLNRETVDVLKKNPFVEYERLDKKYRVELLEKNNRIQRNKTSAAITIGILITLLAIVSFYLLWRLRLVMKKRSVVYNKLVESERELKETMLQKEMAEKQLIEKELFSQEMRLQMEFNELIIQQRRQISDDMHDELSSSLAALNFYVTDMKERAVGTSAAQILSDISEEVKAMYDNARRYMHSLKTNNWETRFSLIGFLKEIQQKFSEKGLMDIKLDLDEESIKSLLATHQHDQLYHIIREAISNVIKHAGATELTVSIHFENDECNFIIADNGKGFKKELVVNGIGIQSMKNRVKDIGGELNIKSFDTGTMIQGRFTL